jgi:hypothetical protein
MFNNNKNHKYSYFSHNINYMVLYTVVLRTRFLINSIELTCIMGERVYQCKNLKKYDTFNPEVNLI